MSSDYLQITNAAFFQNDVTLDVNIQAEVSYSIYVKTGQLELLVSGKIYTLKKNTIFFIGKGTVFRYKSITKEIDCKMMEVSTKIHKQLVVDFSRYDIYRTLQAQDGPLELQSTAFSTLWQHVMVIEYHINRPQGLGYRQRILQNLYTALLYMTVDLILEYKNTAKRINNRQENITMQFLALLEEHFKTERKLDYYAQELDLSAKYLSNCVRKTTGIPPSNFMAKSVMNYAQQQLVNTNISIAELAFQLRFSDAFSFGKFFKKHNGHSPGKFRSLMR